MKTRSSRYEKTREQIHAEMIGVDEAVAALVLGGHTLQEAGDALGFSRERARQRCVRIGLTHRSRQRTRIDPLAVMRELRKPETTSLRMIADALGDRSYVVWHCINELGLARAAQRLFRWRKDRAYLAAFAALAARLGHTPTSHDLAAHVGEVPGQMCMQQRFGGLMAAARRAGLEPNRAGYRVKRNGAA